MGLIYKEFLLLAAISSAVVSSQVNECVPGCKCYSNWLDCRNSGLERPPSGYWPKIIRLWFFGNNVSSMDTSFFVGFPDLEEMNFNQNPLSALDLKSFLGLQSLREISVKHCLIENIISLSGDMELRSLQNLDLTNNSIKSLDPKVFERIPQLNLLQLSENPLYFPSGYPFLSHPTLSHLYLNGVQIYDISWHTFQLLPQLRSLYLVDCEITNLNGAVSNLYELNTVDLSNNFFTVFHSGQIPRSGKLGWLNLSKNPLLSFEPSVLTGIRRRAAVLFDNTPLSCSCGYSDLHQWGIENEVGIYGRCDGSPNCNFTAISFENYN